MHVVDIKKILAVDDKSKYIDVPAKSAKILDGIRASYLNVVMIHGDMILDVSNSEFGYRSCGLWFYYNTEDFEEIVWQNVAWDDYGSPSYKFKLIREFPPGYWSIPRNPNKLPAWIIDHCGYYESGIDGKKFPYWHSDASYSPVSLSDFVECSVEVTGDKYVHHIVAIEGSKYIISIPKRSTEDTYYVCAAIENGFDDCEESREIAKKEKIPIENIVIYPF